MTIKLIKGADNILKEINNIAESSSKMQERLHIVALSVLNHAIQHGDVTVARNLASALVDAFPKVGMIRRNALIQWLCEFGPFAWDMTIKPQKGQAETVRLVYQKKDSYNLEAAALNPFWKQKAKEGSDSQPFDNNQLYASIGRLLAKAEKAAANGNEIDKGALVALRDIVQKTKPSTAPVAA
jgi:hypothetical protein